MVSCFYVVESINDDVELAHKVVAEVMLLDASFETLHLNCWILCGNCLLKTL